MITDEIVEAMDMMMELCSTPEERVGMQKMQDMLLDWSQDDWMTMSNTKKTKFLKQFI